MKKIYNILLLCLVGASLYAAQTMTVEKNDNSKYTIPLEDFKRTYFGDDQPTQPEVIRDTVKVEVEKIFVVKDTVEKETIVTVKDTIEVEKVVTVKDTVEVEKLVTIKDTVEVEVEKIVTVKDTVLVDKIVEVHDTIVKEVEKEIVKEIHDTIVKEVVKEVPKVYTEKEAFANNVIVENEDGTITCYLGLEKLSGMAGGNYYETSAELVDSEEYGGELLYGPSGSGDAEEYIVYEPASGFMTGLTQNWHGDYAYGSAYWSGGAAVSNYGSDNIDDGGYMRQLSVYNANATDDPSQEGNGADGSDFFFMLYGYNDLVQTSVSYDGRAPFLMDDDEPFVINSFMFNNGIYLLNSITYGDGFNVSADENTWVAILVEAYDDEEKAGEMIAGYLCKDGKPCLEWTKSVDLSELGAHKEFRINIIASEDQSGPYGLNVPAYCAIDNIKVTRSAR